MVENRKRALRKRVLRDVRLFYNSRGSEKFIPHVSRVDYAGRVYDDKEMVRLVDAALDFWLTSGRYAGEFERRLAGYVGAKYCILTNSGSSANLLAVSALTSPLLKERRLKEGDEVIATACGFPTTLNPILQNNLKPVFVDVGLRSYNAIPEQVKRAVTPKTKALFLAHTLGNPMELDKISGIARKHNLWFIEDNCDSLGSKYRGSYTGSFGHISTLSFYPAHHITTGEGGAVLTGDTLLKRILLSFRDWGRDCWCETGHDNTCGRRLSRQFGALPPGYDHKYVYSHIGYNLKMTDLQAAIGVEQIKKLPAFVKARRENFDCLSKIFKKYEEYFILPEKTPSSEPSWFGFPLMVKEDAFFDRNAIVKYLEDNNIASRMLFGGNLVKQPAYAGMKYRAASSLVNTNLVMNNLFWIGVYPGITKDKLRYIEKTVNRFFK